MIPIPRRPPPDAALCCDPAMMAAIQWLISEPEWPYPTTVALRQRFGLLHPQARQAIEIAEARRWSK